MSSSAYPWDKLGQRKDFPPSLAGELQSWPERAAHGRRFHLVSLRRKNKPKKEKSVSCISLMSLCMYWEVQREVFAS